MRFVLVTALLASLCAKAETPKTDDEKSLYAIGYIVGTRNLGQLTLKPNELKIVLQGISDGASGKKAIIDTDAQNEKLNAFAKGRSDASAAASSEKERTAAKEYWEKASKEAGVQKLEADVGGKKVPYLYRTITPGSGASPNAQDKVKVDYEGRLTSGTVFDSSYKRGQPAEFGLNQVIKCWTEGVQKMKIGEKAELVCPSEIAYGDHGHPPTIPGGATLVFTVELHAITTGK